MINSKNKIQAFLLSGLVLFLLVGIYLLPNDFFRSNKKLEGDKNVLITGAATPLSSPSIPRSSVPSMNPKPYTQHTSLAIFMNTIVIVISLASWFILYYLYKLLLGLFGLIKKSISSFNSSEVKSNTFYEIIYLLVGSKGCLVLLVSILVVSVLLFSGTI